MTNLGFAAVDAHVHQWDPGTTPREVSVLTRLFGRWPRVYMGVGRAVFPGTPRAFVGDPDIVLKPYLPPDYALASDTVTIDTVVHVQAGWHGRGPLAPVGETRWLQALDFGQSQRLGAIVAYADLRHPRASEVLSAHRDASPKFRGIRHMAAHHPQRGVMKWTGVPDLYRRADFLRGFEQLAKHGLRFDAWAYDHQLDDVAALASRFPETPIMLDHLGTPVAGGGPFQGLGTTEPQRQTIRARWRDALSAVAEHPSVHVKLSGLAMPIVGFGFHQQATPPSVDALATAFAPFVEHGLKCFGPARCVWASNFPMDSVSAPLPHIFEAYRRLIEPHGPDALRAIFRNNALRFYAIDAE